MNLGERTNRILKINIEQYLKKVKNPDKALNKLMVELIEMFRILKMQVLETVRDEKRLRLDYKRQLKKAEEMKDLARQRLAEKDENAARQALVNRNQYIKLAESIEESWTEQKRAVNNLQDLLTQLNIKIDEIRLQKRNILARQRRTKLKKELINKVNETKKINILKDDTDSDIELTAEDWKEIDKEVSNVSLEKQFKELEKELKLLEENTPEDTK